VVRRRHRVTTQDSRPENIERRSLVRRRSADPGNW
jgi:hypothetical protein